MKVKVHMRIARGRNRQHHVVANKRAVHAPITTTRGDALPTVAFALMLDIPDALFEQAEHVIAELTIPESAAQVAAEVKERG